ncbi:PTS sugar transporter subunit IIC [Thermoanaerobacter thermohydrosulfuricus]|uniref:PTS mannose/fructose/sorbose/N-acetylgalactosamine transporter subunit IIC n=1 Tax=Thermoanaerobacter TaxID=1754 RepID=UPI0005744F96|nr:PTS sugar transporter subunit IIC [Thermoanaerobacter sp. YS13]KHO61886.1 Phosphotransferase system, mannose/fructose/N-acetylgalactosamine-specific component IIC [Thermoanaerobacter sp. YS13]MDI3310995.1 PTS sugar transporter subunit IIC [Thermoanaerobacterium sp.]
MNLLFTALLVALVAGILEWDIYGWGQTMISRPLVAGTVMGLILGDIKTGLFIGASVEMIYLGTIPVGAAIPPDATSATTIATALAILSGLDSKVAVPLAIPVAMGAQMLQMLIWTINSGLMHKADQYAEKGDLKGTDRLHYLGSFLFFLQGFIPAFLAILLGVDAVKFMVERMPQWVTNWFTVAGGMLPALGFAMLYVMMSNKKLLPYFIIGFTLAAFFKGTLLAVALIGLALALIYMNMVDNKVKARI